VVVACLLALCTALVPARGIGSTRDTAPNIVVILTDDQRWDTLWAMPNLQSELVAPGMTFTNAFVVNSLCCPSRATILTGKYSHTTLVYDDVGAYGGFAAFRDKQTVARWLHDDGYHTGLIGKYLNGYKESKVGYIPPGWDRWFALLQGSDTGMKYYYDYSVSDQGVLKSYGSDEADYSTDVLAGQADSFIRTSAPGQPLFLYFATSAPHEPATPPVRYANEFSDLPPARPPNYNEADVSDKPTYVRNVNLLGHRQIDAIDALRVDQYRALLAVDDAIGTIVTALADTGRLSNTLIVFASDNGYTWGEHRRRGKLVPYEESIRIPLVVRYDPLVLTPGTDDHLVTNLDLASTFTEVSGATGKALEGMSLVPLLSRSSVTWRDDFLVEHMNGRVVPGYCALRDETSLYVTYQTGEEELYDLTADPYELDNRAYDPTFASTVAADRTRLQELCDPPPPGFVFAYDALPPSQPTSLTATAPRSREVDLSWAASTDNVAVTGYTVYRDGAVVGTVDGATLGYDDLTALPSTTYTYTVDAFDAAGNHSPPSDPAVVTTPP
jgi:arylsulfatase A-like enzyme